MSRTQARARYANEAICLSTCENAVRPRDASPFSSVSWPPSRILDRATFVFIVPISVRQFDDGWASEVLTSNLGRKLERQKQFQILFLVLRCGTVHVSRGKMPTHRCRQQVSIHPGSVEIPRSITDRIELGGVKYPREATGYNRACVTVRVSWATEGTLRKLPCQFRRTQCGFLLLLLLSLLSFLL